MSTPLEEYQRFIDDLLEAPRRSTLARRVREWADPGEKPYHVPKAFDQYMAQFTEEQRQFIGELVQTAHEDGVFAVLVYLNDEINLDGLRLSRAGVELTVEPYGTELYWDWIARRDGAAWPDTSQLKEEYQPKHDRDSA